VRPWPLRGSAGVGLVVQSRSRETREGEHCAGRRAHPGDAALPVHAPARRFGDACHPHCLVRCRSARELLVFHTALEHATIVERPAASYDARMWSRRIVLPSCLVLGVGIAVVAWFNGWRVRDVREER
jgi:hypothetical protein